MRTRNREILPTFDILVVGTNDIHGAAYPTTIARKDTGQKFKYGGLVYMANMIETLKQQNGGNILYLDAGDQFQGGIQASQKVSNGQIMTDYFNRMRTQANAVGNHQFDFGPLFLQNYLTKLQSDILSANLIDVSKGQLPLKNQKKIKNLQTKYTGQIDVDLNEVKIGVIGLSTLETIKTTSGFVKHLFPDSYKFLDYQQIVVKQAQELRKQGAHAVIIVSHVGNQCDKSKKYGIWTAANQTNIPCQMDDEIFKLIDALPKGTIQAVVQGHRHYESHYFYKDVPIIGTINGGYYFNTIKLRFTINGKIPQLKVQDIQIEGPIPVCQKVFQNTKTCQYVPESQLNKAGKLTQWSFHGKKVQADPELERTFNDKYGILMEKYQLEIVKNFIEYPLIKDYAPNSKLGDLISTTVARYVNKKYQHIDFQILNGGGFRSTWYPGVLKQSELFNMFPFNTYIVTFTIKGTHLKKLIQYLQNGKKRYYPTWGLQQKFSVHPLKIRQESKIRNKHLLTPQKLKHQQQFLYLHELISQKTRKPIQPNKYYRGATIDFLLGGGDDFYQIIHNQNITQLKDIKIINSKKYNDTIKQIVAEQFKSMKQITQKSILGPRGLTRFVLKGQTQTQKKVHEAQIENILYHQTFGEQKVLLHQINENFDYNQKK